MKTPITEEELTAARSIIARSRGKKGGDAFARSLETPESKKALAERLTEGRRLAREKRNK